MPRLLNTENYQPLDIEVHIVDGDNPGEYGLLGGFVNPNIYIGYPRHGSTSGELAYHLSLKDLLMDLSHLEEARADFPAFLRAVADELEHPR